MSALETIGIFVLLANYFGLIDTPVGWVIFWGVMLVVDGIAGAILEAKNVRPIR